MSIQCEYDLIVAPGFMEDVCHNLKFETNLRLSEDSPKINRLKGGYFRASIPSVVVGENQLTVSGMVYPYLMYVAVMDEPIANESVTDPESDENPVNLGTDYQPPVEYGVGWNGPDGIPFEETIECPGIYPGAYVEVDFKPLSASFERDGVHEVIFRGELELQIHSAVTQNAAFVKELQPVGRLKVEKEQVVVGEMIEHQQTHLNLDSVLTLPNLKPGISRILDYQVKPAEITLLNGGTEGVRGVIEVTLVYVGSDDEGSPTEIFVNEWSREFGNAIPFEVALDRINVEQGIVIPKVSIGDIQIIVKSAREISCRIELSGEANVLRTLSKEIITDVNSESGEMVDIERQLVNLEEYFGEVSGEISFEAEAVLPSNLPAIERLLAYQAKPVNLKVEAGDGKVFIDGGLDLWVEYVADGGLEQRLVIGNWQQSSHNQLPFSGMLQFSGLSNDALLWSQFRLESVKLEVGSERNLQLTGVIRGTVVAKNPRAVMAVQNCALVAPVDPASRPCMLFYVVQPGDTLWRIARRYQTTVNSLAKSNQIVNPARIEVGQKLIIPKRIS